MESGVDKIGTVVSSIVRSRTADSTYNGGADPSCVRTPPGPWGLTDLVAGAGAGESHEVPEESDTSRPATTGAQPCGAALQSAFGTWSDDEIVLKRAADDDADLLHRRSTSGYFSADFPVASSESRDDSVWRSTDWILPAEDAAGTRTPRDADGLDADH
jgi:hypothetical protein